jgi:acyl-CoA synthetase (AMP-forming)/AMP-acid ligase II
MLYTSGTTGRPKGVYLTQRGCLWVVAASFAPILGLGADDVVLSPLPLFHSYALVLCVIGVAAVGATERILPRFSVQDVLQRLREPGPEGAVTVFPGVPTMFQYLLDRAGADGLGAPSLRDLHVRGRDHARRVERGIREGLRGAAARRLRHHRDLHDGHDELADRLARDGVLRTSVARAHRTAGGPRHAA